MSRDKLLIAGVIVLGLLGFGVYKQMQKDQAIGQSTTASKDMPTISAPEDIDKISLTNGDKPEIVLEKVAGGVATGDGGADGVWKVTKPVNAPANQQTAKDIVTNLKLIKADAKIDLKLDDEVRKDKQLDPAHGVHVIAWKGADKKIDETFGKNGSAGHLLVLTSQPDQVYASKDFSPFLYSKEAKDYRDKDIIKFDDGIASQVTVVNSHGTFSFTKGDKWVATLDKNPIAGFSEDKVKELLKHFKALMADDFGDGKTVADTGLDHPEATLSVVLKDGAGKYDLQLGKVSTGTDRYLKRAGDDVVYQVTNLASDWLTSDASKFVASADAGAPGGGAGAQDAGIKVSQRPKK